MKDIVGHLDHCADARSAMGGPDRGGPVMSLHSSIYGIAVLTVDELRFAAAEIRSLRSQIADLRGALTAMDAEIVNLYTAATGKRDVGERFAAQSPAVQRARALLGDSE